MRARDTRGWRWRRRPGCEPAVPRRSLCGARATWQLLHPLHPLLHRESTYLVCMSMAYELHDVCSFHFYSTSWSHESVDSLEAAGGRIPSQVARAPGRVGCSMSWSCFVSRQLLLVFSVQRLVTFDFSALLHTEAAVVALEAEVAADHTPARRTSRSVFSVYIFLTDQILQLVGQSRR